MSIFIPNSKLGKVRNEFAMELQAKYGKNAKEIHDTLDKIGISFGRPSYKYFMHMLSPLEKGAVLTDEQLEELYTSMMEKFGVTYKQVYGSIKCAFIIAWNRGDVFVLEKMFGRETFRHKEPPSNLRFINSMLKYINELRDDVVVY